MFRKKNKTILEKSLLGEGVDISSVIGHCLLSQMIKYGYSECEASVSQRRLDSDVLSISVKRNGEDFCMGEIARTIQSNRWRISVKKEVLGHPDGGTWVTEIINSKYDVYGK